MGRMMTALAALLLLATAAGYFERWHPLLSIANAFRLHLGVLGAALGIVAGILLLRRAAGLAFLAALLAAVGLGPVYDPVRDSAAAPEDGRVITLLYANLWNRNWAPARLRAALGAIDADILITSETTRRLAGGSDGPWGQYPYHVARREEDRPLRTAIWLKYPLLRGSLYLDNTVAPTGAAAVADLGDGLHLGLIGVHLSRAHEGLRTIQVEALGPISAGLSRPLVVAGDFNAPPWSWVVSRAAEVTGTRVVGGYRITWKGDYPTPIGGVPAPWGHQIDHVLVSAGIAVEEIAVVPLPGSDHRGLLLRLRVAPP
jgi:endonuclease/exonuclease/phosphatase (EEP) superfamily protein YafD